MKIGIDARFVGPQGTGLGKYTEKLIENLQEIDKENNYCIFLTQENWQYLKLKNPNFKKILADIKWYSLEEQLKMAGIFNAQNLDLLHVPHFNVPILYRKKFVVTIHDLIHHNFSQESTTTRNPLVFKVKRAAYKLNISHAVKKSAHIVTPSNFVKEDIIKTFDVPEEKISVIYEAAEEEYFSAKKAPFKLLQKYKINEPFVIYVGNSYPHKNLNNLLKAVKSLDIRYLPEIKLVIVSSRDVFSKRLELTIKELGLEKYVTLTGYISAKELAAIFKRSLAYVFPSLSEGFGIPGLNAMAAQIPLVCSNIPTLKEIYKYAGYYFNPNDVEQIKGKLREVIIKPQLAKYLIQKGSIRVKQFSWTKMAKDTLLVYKNLG